MNDVLERISTVHIDLRRAPSAHTLIENIREGLVSIAAATAAVTSEQYIVNTGVTTAEATEIVMHIFADRGMMHARDNGPNPDEPVAGRLHDFVSAYCLKRVVVERTIRFSVTPDGALLYRSRSGGNQQFIQVDPSHGLQELSSATLTQILADIRHCVAYIYQELRLA